MIAEANGLGAQNPNVNMPGQLQGEAGVLDFEPDAADQVPILGGAEGDGTDDEVRIEVCRVEVFSDHFSETPGRLHNSRFP